MNDRCAAGTGRFLEVLATRLGVRLASLGELAHRSERPAIISSMCVVFAETEIIGLLASGTPPADIVAGVQASIATRVAAMSGRNVATPVIFTGGVAMVPGMDVALENALRTSLLVPPDPQFTCALVRCSWLRTGCARRRLFHHGGVGQARPRRATAQHADWWAVARFAILAHPTHAGRATQAPYPLAAARHIRQNKDSWR